MNKNIPKNFLFERTVWYTGKYKKMPAEVYDKYKHNLLNSK